MEIKTKYYIRALDVVNGYLYFDRGVYVGLVETMKRSIAYDTKEEALLALEDISIDWPGNNLKNRPLGIKEVIFLE